MTVKITTGFIGRKQARIELFATTFTTSEGPDARALIADLVRDLIAETPTVDIRVFCAEDEGYPPDLLGRLKYRLPTITDGGGAWASTARHWTGLAVPRAGRQSRTGLDRGNLAGNLKSDP